METGSGAYTRGQSLPSLVVLCRVGLVEDVVAPVLKANRVVEPIGSLVVRCRIHMSPHVWVSGDDQIGSNTGNRT